MTSKEYLNQARRLDKMINSRLREIDYWKDLSTRLSGVRFDGMPHSPNQPVEAPFVGSIERIDESRRSVEDKVAYLISLRDEINRRIGMLDDHDEQVLLRYRYIDGFTWEEIENMMNVSERTAFRIHGSALAHFPMPD